VELLSVSANLKEQGKRYEKSFELVKDHESDMTYFIDFCLDSLISAVKNVEQKINYLAEFLKLTETGELNVTQVCLLQKMALNKYSAVTIEGYAQEINKSREIARRELNGLLSKNLLREGKKGKKYIYFIESKTLREKIKKLS